MHVKQWNVKKQTNKHKTKNKTNNNAAKTTKHSKSASVSKRQTPTAGDHILTTETTQQVQDVHPPCLNFCF